MRNIRRNIIISIIFCFLVSSVFADIVYLKNGKIIRGKITERNDINIIVETETEWFRIELKDITKIVFEKEKPIIEVIKPEIKEYETAKGMTSCCLGGLVGVGALFIGLIFLSFVSR